VVEPVVVAAGGMPETIRMTLHNGTGKNIDCPHPKVVPPGAGVLGALFDTPAGQRLEISRVGVPRRLSDFEHLPLAKNQRRVYETPWPRHSGELRQAGLYLLFVFLTWLIEGDDSKEGPELYHVRTVAPAAVWVVSRDPVPAGKVVANGQATPTPLESCGVKPVL
jgi:hypothetical protein